MKGSWFVQCLCRIFMKYSGAEDLDTLLLRVTQELKAYCTTKGEKQINETLLRGVTKKLFFNPGVTSPHSHHTQYSGQTQQPQWAMSASITREAALEMTGDLSMVWSGLGSGDLSVV